MYSGSGKRLHRALAGLIGIALLVFQSAALAETATLAVAANFTGTMNRLAPLFEQQTGHQLRISYGST
ncbi:substrate-binding domain-containing protein, partial [uncultured Marinobacter sp.]